MTFPNPAPGLADSRISVLGLPGLAGQMPAPPEGVRGPAPAPPRLLSHPGLVSAALALAHQELVLWMLFSGVCVCVCVCVLGPGNFHLPEAVSLLFGRGEDSRTRRSGFRSGLCMTSSGTQGCSVPSLGCRLLVLEMRV